MQSEDWQCWITITPHSRSVRTIRRGLCNAHYLLWKEKYYGLCVLAEEGCRNVLARKARRGLCSTHYHAWRRYGDPYVKGEIGRRGEAHWRFIFEGPSTHQGRHQRLRRARGRAVDNGPCVDCEEEARDWSQIHETDGLDIYNDYVPRCRRCHQIYDEHPFYSRR